MKCTANYRDEPRQKVIKKPATAKGIWDKLMTLLTFRLKYILYRWSIRMYNDNQFSPKQLR